MEEVYYVVWAPIYKFELERGIEVYEYTAPSGTYYLPVFTNKDEALVYSRGKYKIICITNDGEVKKMDAESS